jgi:cation transport ATPase
MKHELVSQKTRRTIWRDIFWSLAIVAIAAVILWLGLPVSL